MDKKSVAQRFVKQDLTDHYIGLILTSNWDNATKIHLLELLGWDFFNNPIAKEKYISALQRFGKKIPPLEQFRNEKGVPKLSNPQQLIPEINDDSLKEEIVTIMQKLSIIKIDNFNHRIQRDTTQLEKDIKEKGEYPDRKGIIQHRIEKLIEQQLNTISAKMIENLDIEELKKDEQSLLFLQNISEINEALLQNIKTLLQRNKDRQNQLQGKIIIVKSPVIEQIIPTSEQPTPITAAPVTIPQPLQQPIEYIPTVPIDLMRN